MPPSKPFWQRINKMRYNKSTNDIPNIYFEDKVYSSDDDKANIFANKLYKTFNEDNNNTFDGFKEFVDDYNK